MQTPKLTKKCSQHSLLNKKLAFAAVLLTSVSAHTQAADYQIEGFFDYSSEQFDNAFNTERSLTTVGLNYYFQPVSDTNRPLLEAAFLSQSSSMFAGIQFIDREGFEDEAIVLGGEYIDKNSGLILGGDLHTVNGNDEIGLHAGLYINPYTTVEAEVRDIENTNDEQWTFSAKTLMDMGAQTALGLEGSYAFWGESRTLRAGANYFLSHMLSLGGNVALISNDDNANQEATELGGQAAYFFTPQLGGAFSYTLVDRDDNVDSDRTELNFWARF